MAARKKQRPGGSTVIGSSIAKLQTPAGPRLLVQLSKALFGTGKPGFAVACSTIVADDAACHRASIATGRANGG
ncbi:MAG: hypothetical protein U0805_05990 [Pirellulales bacterium]